MNNKKRGVLTGVFFILGTAMASIGVSFIEIINEENFLKAISNNPNRLLIGAMFLILMAISCAAIAMSIYPVIKKHRPGLAIGSLGFRLMETTLFMTVAISLLVLLNISKEFAVASNDMALIFEVNGSLVKDAYNVIWHTSAIAFALGALLYYIAFYQLKVVPKWLSIWGIIAAILHIGSGISIILGVTDSSIIIIILNAIIALQEMVLAVWLIIKGFNKPENISINA